MTDTHTRHDPDRLLRYWPDLTFMETYGNPHLLECSCGCKCGKRLCRNGRKLQAACQQYDERQTLLAALTDEDLAWLSGHGWRP
jgi:hypothetical protein